MPTAMRALKTFTGRPGEGHRLEHLVEAGDDFNVEAQTRVEYLERRGLAMRAAVQKPAAKMQPPPANKMEPAPTNKVNSPQENKAADVGPLDLRGGETGGAEAQPSSHPGRQPRRRPSARSEDGYG